MLRPWRAVNSSPVSLFGSQRSTERRSRELGHRDRGGDEPEFEILPVSSNRLLGQPTWPYVVDRSAEDFVEIHGEVFHGRVVKVGNHSEMPSQCNSAFDSGFMGSREKPEGA